MVALASIYSSQYGSITHISTSHEFLIPSTVDDIEKYKLSAKDKSNSNKIRIYELVRYSAAHNFAYLSRIPITMKGILLM